MLFNSLAVKFSGVIPCRVLNFQVVEEVVNRLTEENIKLNSIATNNGLAMAFGGKKGG